MTGQFELEIGKEVGFFGANRRNTANTDMFIRQ
jgi:hypothetical protein